MPTALPVKNPGHTSLADGAPKLTGLKFFVILLGLFSIVAGVNATMIYYAVSSFPGTVTDHPYERGLAYNQDIAEARAQAERNWHVDVRLQRAADGREQIEMTAKDAAGAALTDLDVSAVLELPVEKKGDLSVALKGDGTGKYRGTLMIGRGERTLVLTAGRDGQRLFLSRNRINLN